MEKQKTQGDEKVMRKIPVLVFTQGKFRLLWFEWKLGLMMMFLPTIILKNKDITALKEMKE